MLIRRVPDREVQNIQSAQSGKAEVLARLDASLFPPDNHNLLLHHRETLMPTTMATTLRPGDVFESRPLSVKL